ncbi:MAG: hypothetical protein AABX45_01925 [Nanoarchaeota archaeon]
MNKKQFQKNLYDLEYHEVLNYQNMSMILIGTFIISFILSNYPNESKVIIIFLSILVIIYFRYIFNKRLQEIRSKIKELK